MLSPIPSMRWRSMSPRFSSLRHTGEKFLLSAILVIVGLVVRVHMEETPIFRMAQEQKKVVKSPLTEVFRKSWRR